MDNTDNKLIALEIDIAKCKQDMSGNIRNINAKLLEQDTLRANMNSKLDAIADQSRKNYQKFDSHTREEMEKYEEMIHSIRDLKDIIHRIGEQTKENKRFKDSEIHNRELEARVAQELKELNAPRDEFLHKVKMTAITVVTGTVVSGMLAILWFGFKAYVQFGFQ